jgi:acyl-[acyl-carrier-protein]-phospholipid O-acyltransferase/long-chain-fatty-acid--[acyl-carrier-protein] ligase
MVYLSVLLVASHNAFFTPCKFAIIPELVATDRLSRANGQVQLFTFLALLAGTLLAPRLSLALDGAYHIVLVFCVLIAVFNLFAALLIGRTPAHPDRIVRINGARMLAQAFKGMLNDQSLLGTVLAISFFSLIAIYCQMNMITYGDEHLGIGPEASTYLFLIAAVGIGIGSAVTGILSGKSILLAFIPGGAFLMLASLLTLGMLPDGSLTGVLVCMLVFGLGAGAYIVPLEAFLQFRSPADRIGSIKAANGILNWIGILIASGLVHLNSTVLKLPARTGFLMLSLLLFALLVSNFWLHSIQKPIIQSQS